MIDLLSCLPEEIADVLSTLHEPRYRAKQIFDWCRRGTPIGEMTNLPAALREKLREICEWRLPTVEVKQTSALDGTVKYLFRLVDGNCVESVLMRYRHGTTLCISSEVGCPMGCKFCASTIGGKVRNLEPSEMLGQVIAASLDAGERIDGIVLMGIGEPLDNYDNVMKFLRLVGHPDGLNIGYRHISLSTCGIVPRIYDLAQENLPITLSVSLHAATDEARSAIMPINRRYPVAELLRACADYFKVTGRRISFEYTLIAGKNDSTRDAELLADVLLSHLGRVPIHVNLIRVNEVAETGFRHGTAGEANAFAEVLNRRGIVATVRRRLGADIDAACGQLRKKQADGNGQGDAT